jgi:hypothetical protein
MVYQVETFEEDGNTKEEMDRMDRLLSRNYPPVLLLILLWINHLTLLRFLNIISL